MRKEPRSLTADPEIRASFQGQLADARETPGLRRLVRKPAPDLYPCYSGYYRQLCQLPRRVRRALQRQWKRSLPALALLLALGQAPALAATIHVDGTNCTLADAIRSANTNAAVGGCSKGSGADRLVLAPKSTHTLTTVEDTIYGNTGLSLVTSTVTIAGQGSTIERGAGAPNFRLLAVSHTGKLTLETLTLRGGYAPFPEYGGGVLNSGGNLTLTDCTVSGNTAFPGGGGVSNSGILTVTNSTISGNTVNEGGCHGACGPGGGGMFNDGTLILTNSTVSGNTAYYFGGGVSNGGVSKRGILTITNSTVAGNRANYGGGVHNREGRLTLTNSTVSGNTGSGVYNDGTVTLENSTVSGNNTAYRNGGGLSNHGTLNISNSTVSGNTAHSGGGMFNDGTLTLTNSTVSGNKVQDFGGGVYNSGTLTVRDSTVSDNMASRHGGGVSNGGRLTLTNGTVSGNKAGRGGGGLLNDGTLNLRNSTVAGNTANYGGGVFNAYSLNISILTLSRSILSGNAAKRGPEALNNTESGTVHTHNFNLFGHNGNAGVVGFLPGATDIVPTVALNRILAPLAANGGLTLTRALVSGSPAIDAVQVGCPPPATDQRGLPRPVDGDGDLEKRCDIGAFEFDPRGVCASVPPSKGCTVNGVPDKLCRGTADDDTIVGTSGNDVILGRIGKDVLSGLAGHDLLCGGQHKDLIRGGAGQDNIEGNNGKDKLFGSQGNDWIKGGRGNDDLDGGSGKDRLDGQQGTDTCVNGESVRSCP